MVISFTYGGQFACIVEVLKIPNSGKTESDLTFASDDLMVACSRDRCPCTGTFDSSI